MRVIEVYGEDTKDIAYDEMEYGNITLTTDVPQEENKNAGEILTKKKNTLKVLWRETFRYKTFVYREEDLLVKDKVWMETYLKDEEIFEHDIKFFVHKDVLNRKMTDDELKFLNAYRGRFIFLKEVENEIENYFVYDNETQKKFKAKVSDGSLHNFKLLLKSYSLI